MKDDVLILVLTQLLAWRCPAHLYGTAALMVCASRAIERERKGEPWNAFRVCQQYAEEKGGVQHSVWVNIAYALKHSKGPGNPAEAINAIVKEAYKHGVIDGGAA